ncbi:DNA-binding protein RFX2-like isoform X2 [Hydractinia symbiolongicarpus]|uniref:DNA-binding protein RFX2-like isoform X2 n=1 Tax=Hydractinia symbiolongicarpus TaxID=13093 RepID=UPI00254F65C3|nr:DNA-binding protein RFX2-like isoform X2 [Hydractinia symbiolongicarpus]
MASSTSPFGGGRTRSVSHEHEDRNNNIEYSKLSNLEYSKNLQNSDSYKPGLSQYRSSSDSEFRGAGGDYRVNPIGYRTNSADFNRNSGEYRNDFRLASEANEDYRSSYRDLPASEYKNDFRSANTSGENNSNERTNSGEYSPGGRLSIAPGSGGSSGSGGGSGGGGGGYPPHFWNYLGSFPGRRVSSFPYGSNNDSAMYSQTSNMPSYMDGSHGSHPSQNQMYQTYPSQASHPGSMGVGVSAQAIGVAQQAQYLQPGQAASQRVPISHTTRASPVTVHWLLENYETADGVSLPRSTLYHHYLRHSAENKIDAVNAASFGKLIRSVFLGLKTRRLGTRGNSKYHYYGIRVKPNSVLARLTDDTQVALRATPSTAKRTISSTSYDDERGRLDHPSSSEEGGSNAAHQQYLGDASEGLPGGITIELLQPLPEGLTKQSVMEFGSYYRAHSESLLEVISGLQFELVESLWQAFYKSPAAINKMDNGTLEPNDYNVSKNDLVVLCKYKPVQVFIKETDYALYQKLVNILVPDVLRAVPSSLTQTIRNFAKSLENMLIGSMSEMPKEIVNVKVAAVSAFSQTLRRYTSLNHLAQAARAVLQNPQQINQMWNDLNKVDFNNVQEQSSWVCQCDESLITKLEQDFKTTLAQQQSLEQWAQWLESVVGAVLESHEGRDSYPKAARHFLLNWSFYSSMIIRDLTLRSAASFGSFHLIRLLYDEYMFYLIEHKVAKHTGKSPMSVMAECVGLSSLSQGNFNGNAGMEEEDDLDDSSNDGSALTPTAINADAAIQSRPGNQPEPLMSQTAVNYDEPIAKRMKQDYST